MSPAAALQQPGSMPPRVVEFTVKGESIGQGSMTSHGELRRDPTTGKAIVKTWARHSNPNLVLWRQKIEAAIQQQVGELAFKAPTPVKVCAVFYLFRGTSLHKTQTKPVTGRDLDKLARAACDAMSATVYTDDKQITDLHVKKRYAWNGTPRAVFYVTEDTEPEPIAAAAPPRTWPDMPKLF